MVCAVIAGTVLAAWSQWQPLRSEQASQKAVLMLRSDPASALGEAQSAVNDDPLSASALIYLARIAQSTGRGSLARATFQRAVRLQPSNPETWLAIGEYDLHARPRQALAELSAAIYLNPQSVAPELVTEGSEEAITIQNDYVQALRAAER